MKPASKNIFNTWIANPYILLLIPVLAFLLIGGASTLAGSIALPDTADYTSMLPEKKAVSLFQMTCEFVGNIKW
ncbi:MAG: hypothetical protein INR69_03810 [Mucilaginibacter polytrichastri]|nr:hypothetical protein [Mucilaginibacter polytrichastri]